MGLVRFTLLTKHSGNNLQRSPHEDVGPGRPLQEGACGPWQASRDRGPRSRCILVDCTTVRKRPVSGICIHKGPPRVQRDRAVHAHTVCEECIGSRKVSDHPRLTIGIFLMEQHRAGPGTVSIPGSSTGSRVPVHAVVSTMLQSNVLLDFCRSPSWCYFALQLEAVSWTLKVWWTAAPCGTSAQPYLQALLALTGKHKLPARMLELCRKSQRSGYTQSLRGLKGHVKVTGHGTSFLSML